MEETTPTQTELFEAIELGAMMREIRENLGHDLPEVAESLRIRLVYLEAIESGRLNDLPGNAYVSGFLKSYSNYLGLDGEKIVRQFKIAEAEIGSRPPLILPSPVDEGRLPTALILLVAAVIAAAAYGGWYHLSSRGGDPTETVAKLPDDLSARLKGAANQRVPAPAQVQLDESIDAGTVAGPASSASVVNPTGAVSPQQMTESAETRPALVQGSELNPQTASSPSPSAAEQPVSHILSGDSADTNRIVVRAISDSYVTVRTSDNQPLFSRLMRTGDRYDVPSGSDLFLETGNAGVLRITVDGKLMPSLGPIGKVRRNIPLNAESLMSGAN